MAFETTKNELIEVYTLLKILSEGRVFYGDESGNKLKFWATIKAVKRQEHDGERIYKIDGENILISNESYQKTISRKQISDVLELLLKSIKEGSNDSIEVDDSIEKVLDEMGIYNLESKTNDRTDIHLSLSDDFSGFSGFVIRSRIGGMNSLLNGGRTANIKYEQTGVKFSSPTVNKINATPESENEVYERMMFIERLGGVLKYSDVADKVFRSNLMMIDIHFPRVVSEMLKIFHLENIRKIDEITEIIESINPLKIKDELITKHHFYRYKIKQFLLELALGMRSAKIYNGSESEIKGMLLISGSGDVVCYHISRKKLFEEFLLKNTKLDKSSLEKDKYGFLERENGNYYFKLNLKISLTKR